MTGSVTESVSVFVESAGVLVGLVLESSVLVTGSVLVFVESIVEVSGCWVGKSAGSVMLTENKQKKCYFLDFFYSSLICI